MTEIIGSIQTGRAIVLVLFAVVFLLMGTRPFNIVRLPAGYDVLERRKRGLHWFFNLLGMLCWLAAWMVYPSGLVRGGQIERPDWMILPAILLLVLGFVMVVIGLGRNWRKGDVDEQVRTGKGEEE